MQLLLLLFILLIINIASTNTTMTEQAVTVPYAYIQFYSILTVNSLIVDFKKKHFARSKIQVFG